jgi:thymidylate synthase
VKEFKMPYIKEDRRKTLDPSIHSLVAAIKLNANNNANLYDEEGSKLTNEQFLEVVGDINYAFSRVLSNLMGDISYSKIAIITGVLENIKQEYYRRVAQGYEDKKMLENGDIKEYKRLK